MTKPDTASHGVRLLEVGEDSDGQRIDNYLLKQLKGVPKSVIYKILRKGEVRVDKKRAKPDYRLSIGEMVRIPPVRQASRGEPQPVGDGLKKLIEDAILYEDDALMVVNKPAGLAVHGGSGVSVGLIEVIREMRQPARFLELVHRLDKDTSGCIMVAKKRSMLKTLHQKLRDDSGIQKQYLALVCGRWKGKQHRIEAPLEKFHLASGERMVRVAREGKPSLTLFKWREHFAGATLVEAYPVTGRTHQIRVHALHAGHPLAGDPKYTPQDLNAGFRESGLRRLFLHASRISVPDLFRDGEAFEVEAPLDPELEGFLQVLRAREKAGGEAHSEQGHSNQ
ncbi:MAG: 23S rRNA pseudouridine(955/2504/2580) synthase RluC [Ketobacteraceae bacterium]|nr:23S rRNA pseudouridine(955/2504/2580) synthase RluC [Ketobacteraceae bacterium]